MIYLENDKLEKISKVFISLTIILNILMMINMPSDMLVKLTYDETMPKIITLVIFPIMSIILFKAFTDKKTYMSNIAYILSQGIFFISNILLIFRNI